MRSFLSTLSFSVDKQTGLHTNVVLLLVAQCQRTACDMNLIRLSNKHASTCPSEKFKSTCTLNKHNTGESFWTVGLFSSSF